MPEQHNIEYKTSWHEDHLKTICAYANSQGGKLYIGKDDGFVIGHGSPSGRLNGLLRSH